MIFNMIVGAGNGSGATLTVTAPANVSVTISKSGNTKTKTSDSNGIAEFIGLDSGTWSVKISNGSQTASKTVKITTDFSTSIAFFSAKISVTYPSGSTCTCTNGSTTLTATSTTGSYTFTVTSTGTWTVSCTDGSKTDSESVSITNDGQSKSVTLNYATYLYKAGDEYTATTGGLVEASSGDTSYWKYSNIVKGTSNIQFKCTDDRSVFYNILRTKNTINMSNYKTLKMKVTAFTYSGGTQAYGYLTATKSTEYGHKEYAVGKKFNPGITDTIISIDVSSLSDKHYVTFGATFEGNDGTGSMKVTEVWLE